MYLTVGSDEQRRIGHDPTAKFAFLVNFCGNHLDLLYLELS